MSELAEHEVEHILYAHNGEEISPSFVRKLCVDWLEQNKELKALRAVADAAQNLMTSMFIGTMDRHEFSNAEGQTPSYECLKDALKALDALKSGDTEGG